MDSGADIATDQVSVLIAEDSLIQAQILKGKLEEAGYAVTHAADGQLALDAIRDARPTLVISDIEMPNMTGYELCSAVKGGYSLKRLEV